MSVYADTHGQTETQTHGQRDFFARPFCFDPRMNKSTVLYQNQQFTNVLDTPSMLIISCAVIQFANQNNILDLGPAAKIHVHVGVHVDVHVDVRVSVHVHIYIHFHSLVNVHVCIDVHIHIHVHVDVDFHVHGHVLV